MKAQKLYDLRDQFGFTSGERLHNFFFRETGDPSPAGETPIRQTAAREFINEECERIIRMDSDYRPQMQACKKAI